jgi:S-formylglutathione hydrolase FrmB
MRRAQRVPFFVFIFLVSFLVGVESRPAQAQGRINCDLLNSRILLEPVHYCVMLPPAYEAATPGQTQRRYPVLYFLHGLGDNEQALLKSGGWNLVEDQRQQGKIGDFLIVAPEGRRSFYINSADGRVRYSDFFIREFMPYIEARYRIQRQRRSRAITGISMGGYGALRFAFAHPDLFSSVSAQSAALMTESPEELNAAIRSGMPLGRMLGAVFGQPIDVAHWKQNDPFLLARKNKAGLAGLAIYFNCGSQDEYDFENGAQALDRQLQSENIKHEFHLYPGDHSPAYFLTHLGETMEFHWRVFAQGK